MRRWLAAILFVGAIVAGTWLDARFEPPPRSGLVLSADLHVHPYPGDGALTVAQLRREAARRGLDVIAITSHNHQFALRLPSLAALWPPRPSVESVMVLPGQEVTTPGFHLIAVGIDRVIDWRLSVTEAVAEIHQQGGAAIAAHPIERSWRPLDGASLAALDGAEVAHPITAAAPSTRAVLETFFARAAEANPDLAPVGSTDFHVTGPLGRCRTYLIVPERSPAGAIAALRRGTTVAGDHDGRLHGSAPDVALVRRALASAGPVAGPSTAEKTAALTALFGLLLAILPLGSR